MTQSVSLMNKECEEKLEDDNFFENLLDLYSNQKSTQHQFSSVKKVSFTTTPVAYSVKFVGDIVEFWANGNDMNNLNMLHKEKVF